MTNFYLVATCKVCLSIIAAMAVDLDNLDDLSEMARSVKMWRERGYWAERAPLSQDVVVVGHMQECG